MLLSITLTTALSFQVPIVGNLTYQLTTINFHSRWSSIDSATDYNSLEPCKHSAIYTIRSPAVQLRLVVKRKSEEHVHFHSAVGIVGMRPCACIFLWLRVRVFACANECVWVCVWSGCRRNDVGWRLLVYVIRMLWMSWNTAEPQTTKINSPNNHGPTGSLSSSCLRDLGTLPRLATFLLCFSFASRIFCFGAIAIGPVRRRTERRIYSKIYRRFTSYQRVTSFTTNLPKICSRFTGD